jgi:hypothetical protein
MDSVVTVAKIKADTAKSVSKNLAINSISAFNTVLEGKGEAGLNAKLEKKYATMRLKLFMKYSMIDYEILLSGINRNDIYSND